MESPQIGTIPVWGLFFLALGCYLLALSCWLLAVGSWLLSSGLVLLRPVGTLGLSVRCIKGYDIQPVRSSAPQRVTTYPPNVQRYVGTHGLCVRSRQRLHRQDRSTTDAQIVRPYRTQLRLESSRSASVVLKVTTSRVIGVYRSGAEGVGVDRR